jgi:hypothetical protein
VTTTVDDLVPKTFYIPGLNFRGQVNNVAVSIIAQNANGAVELSWLRGFKPTDTGSVTVHSTTSRAVAESFAQDCMVLGGPCFGQLLTAAFRDQFATPVGIGDMRLVCVLLAQWHDECFAHRPVQP